MESYNRNLNILRKFTVVAVVVLLIVVLIEVSAYFFIQFKKNTKNKKNFEVATSSQNTNAFFFHGSPLEEGIVYLPNGKIRIIGKFRSKLYINQGMNIADVAVDKGEFKLVFGESDWPILTYFSPGGEISAPKKRWVGKSRDELNSYIKEGDGFLSFINLPIKKVKKLQFPLQKDTEKWQSLSPKMKEYYESNWKKIESFLESYFEDQILREEIGLVNSLMLR